MLKPSCKSVQWGYSLIELLVGVAILGILATVAVPKFKTWLNNTQIRNAAESIVNGLQLARAAAVNHNSSAIFVICPALDSSWDILIASPTAINQPCAADNAGLPGWQRIQNRASSEGAKNVKIAMTPTVSRIAAYNSFGATPTVNPYDGTAFFTQIDVDSTILTSSESADLRIILNAGSSRMCSPNAPPSSTSAC